MADPIDGRGPGVAMDWERARARLDRAEAALAAGDSAAPEEVHRILRDRALRLAAPPVSTTLSQPVDLVLFRSGNGRYAIDAGHADVVLHAAATPLPGVPSFHLGLVLHRGEVYPLVDIGPLLGLGPAGRDGVGYAILCSAGEGAIAIAADAIDGLYRLDGAGFALPPESEGHSAIHGMTVDGAVIIDVARLLRDARLTINDQPPIHGGAKGEDERDHVDVSG